MIFMANEKFPPVANCLRLDILLGLKEAGLVAHRVMRC